MAGWNLEKGEILNLNLNEEGYWAHFNYVFSESCAKRNSYKFGLIKSILDNLLNATFYEGLYFLSYDDIFEKFTENYWALVNKYDLRQMHPDGKSVYSKVEVILKDIMSQQKIDYIEFSSLKEDSKTNAIKAIKKDCIKYVIGALYNDLEGTLYSFDKKGLGIYICEKGFNFLLKYKMELERLNYYSWAKFLEKVNENKCTRIIDKLELATPKRNNLSYYQYILYSEFMQNNCFYCGKKLERGIHVDHFIPWSFTKEDKLWNFVLACPNCNVKKNNKLATEDFLHKLEKRNDKVARELYKDFSTYSNTILKDMWDYALMSGYKRIKL